MRITEKDIKVVSEGEQVKNVILKKYETLEAFIKNNNLIISLETLKMYTRKRKLTSLKFINELESIFNENYYVLIMNEEKQIKNYVNSLWQKRNMWDLEVEEKILDILFDMCNKNNMRLEAIKIQWTICKTIFYHRKAMYKLSIEMMENVINDLRVIDNKLLLCICLDELKLMYSDNYEYEKAEKIIKQVSKLILENNIDDKRTLFYCNFRNSIVFYKQGKYYEALDCAKKSVKYADTRALNIMVNNFMGLIYLNIEEFENALKYLLEIKGDSTKDEYTSNKSDSIVEISDISSTSTYQVTLRNIDKQFMNSKSGCYNKRIKSLGDFISYIVLCKILLSINDKKGAIRKLKELLHLMIECIEARELIVANIKWLESLVAEFEDESVCNMVTEVYKSIIISKEQVDKQVEIILQESIGRMIALKHTILNLNIIGINQY